MITLLSRLLIPDHEKTDLPEVRRLYGVLSGTVGIFLNLILFAGKLAAGILAHSISIMADAFNNLSDAASSIISMLGFKLSAKKADPEHPFGHGRMEYIRRKPLLRSAKGSIQRPDGGLCAQTGKTERFSLAESTGRGIFPGYWGQAQIHQL